MKGALDVHRALLAAGVPHEVVRLAARITDADQLPAALGLDDGCLAVRCYVPDGPAPLVAVLVPAGTLPAPGRLRQALGARTVRAASPDEVQTGTDCAAGLVSPVDLPAQVPLLADAAVGRTDVVYAPVGEAGLALGVRAQDLLAATGARVTELGSRPAGRAADGGGQDGGLNRSDDAGGGLRA